MKPWTFVLEHWRTAVFFFLSMFFAVLILTLDMKQSGLIIPWGDVGYIFILAVACFLAFLAIEYLIRRPFYLEAQARLKADSTLHTADTFTPGATAEQRLLVQLLHHYYRSYAKELAALEEKRKFFELFTLRFAHQMKTPVTVIQLLEDELRAYGASAAPPAGEDLNPILESLAEERSRLDQSLTTMLYTARVNAFSFDAKMEAVPLLPLIRNVINAHKAEWIRKSIFPKIDVTNEQLIVESDQKWLYFIVEQIVRNALQYGRKPKPARDANDASATFFTIRIRDQGDSIQVEFIDEGIGIPARDLQRIFEPFYTGGNGRTHSRATGMGLYLVQEAARLLGHTVRVNSEEGLGTTVIVAISQSRYYAPMKATPPLQT